MRNALNRKFILLYEGITSKSEVRVEENQEFMLSVLRAAISFKLHGTTQVERSVARDLACDIGGFKVFQRQAAKRQAETR